MGVNYLKNMESATFVNSLFFEKTQAVLVLCTKSPNHKKYFDLITQSLSHGGHFAGLNLTKLTVP